MAGRRPKVDHNREDFLRAIDSAKKLYSAVQQVAGINPNAKCPRLHTQHVGRVVELAFMGVIAAWEDFLEGTLIRYMCGAETDTGFTPNLRIGKCINMGHAYQVLTGDPNHDPAKEYTKASDPKYVIESAKLYFSGGNPYQNSLTNKTDRLHEAVKIRNRVAHSSQKCIEDFKTTAKRLLNTNSLTQGFRAADLLRGPATTHFGQQIAHQGISFFDAFLNMYEALAKKIVP